MEEQRIANDEIEIDLREIAGVLIRKLKVLVLCLLAGALIAGGVTRFLITPLYTGTSMIFILTKTTSVTSLADIQLGSELTTDFVMLATSRPTLEQVIEDLDLDMERQELAGMITVSNPTNTRILQIDVENPDPQLAADISNALADTTADAVAEIMSTDRPTIVEDAVAPEHPSSPSLLKNIAIGGAIGLILAMAVVILRFLMDDTIKTEEDVTKYLDLNTLAALPVDEKADPSGGNHEQHKGKRRKFGKKSKPEKKKVQKR